MLEATLRVETNGKWHVGIPAKLDTVASFSWCVKLNLGFGSYACHGTPTLIQSQHFTTFYDFTTSLTFKDNGQLGERPSGAGSFLS